MTDLLEQAIDQARHLSPDAQDQIAWMILGAPPLPVIRADGRKVDEATALVLEACDGYWPHRVERLREPILF